MVQPSMVFFGTRGAGMAEADERPHSRRIKILLDYVDLSLMHRKITIAAPR